MSFCVNRNSLEFKNLVNELNIHPNQLEMIIHEYINREGAGSDQYPSIDYIKSKMSGGVWSIESKAQLDLYNREYSTPRIISSEALAEELAKAKSFFPEEAINITLLEGGDYQLSLSNPVSTERNTIYENREVDELSNLDVLDALTSEFIDGQPIVKKVKDGYFLNNYFFGKDTYTKFLDRLRGLGISSESIGIIPNGKSNAGLLYVKSHTSPIEDTITALEESTDLFSSVEDRNNAIAILEFLRDKTGLNYKFISLDEAKAMGQGIKGQNAFVSGDTAYYITGRKFNTEVASEEMLHPFVSAIRRQNPAAFSSLYIDARQLFPKLSLQTTKAYRGKDSNIIKEEIVTKALSRSFRVDIKETPEHHPFTDFIKKFLAYVEKWFRNTGDIPIFSKEDKLYATDLAKDITLKNLASIINTEVKLAEANRIYGTRSNLDEKSTLERAAENSQRLVNQYNNLGQDNLFSSTEMHHIAEQLVYFLGDRITDYLVDPQLLLDDVAEIAENSDVKITIPEDAVDKIPNMTRLELVNYIGADNLINIIKEQLFNPSINSNIGANATTFRARNRAFRQANLIKDNIGLILELANDTFIRNEGFAIVFDDYVNKKAVEVTDSESFKDDKEGSEAEIAERGESLQEHWQIEFRTQDTMTSMSQIVRQAINNCFELDEDGNEILDTFGLPQRREPRASTQAILRVTQGSLNLADMISKMRASLKENPWMQQLIDRLEDKSGKESDFQSQFYGVFQKHFQTYNIVKFNEKTKKFESFPVNIHPARKDAKDSIRNLFRLGEHPMYSLDGVNTEMFNNFKQWYNELVEAKGKPIDDENIEHIFDLCNAILRTIGLNLDENVVKSAINSNTLNTIVPAIGQIIKVTESVINSGRKAWNPFEFSKEGISGNVDVLIAPFTDMLEDSTSSAFYESGKMYQSYVIPSYMTTLMNKFKQKGDEFNKFLEEEYGASEWYRNKGVFDPELADAWRCPWLSLIASDADKKAMFDHKVELAFNKHNYMRTMDDNEYALSLISEFFVEKVSSKSSEARAWYRVPMLSNKPSSEFIQFVRYTGSHYQDTLTAGFMKIFNQELSRIQTVEQRAAEGITKSDERYIKNFDDNGKKFNFLTFLNDYLKGGDKENTELGKLLNAKISSGRVNEAQLNALVDSEIRSVMNAKADEIISDWRARGITATATKKIQGFDESNADSMLREFIWNDTFATMNIMEILVTDPAFYKDAEDLQKRFAQIHAPGIRGNKDATDYNGKKVSDGFHRSVTLKDFEGDVVKSNIIDNLLVVFNRKLDEYKKKYPSDEDGYQAQVEYYDSIIDAYENEINAADAQSFISPTAYRKNAFIFGKWNPKKEELYQKIKSGTYTYGDLQTVFGQPLKPFVYGKASKQIGTEDSPIQTIQMPIQNKNSEYLLLMADAILQGENTGRPNLLRAIFRVMEESAEANDGAGIDSIQLESAVKSGLCGRVDLTSYLEEEDGETKAYDALKDAIYTKDNNGELTTDYNTNVVQKLDFDYYCIQQEVPAHFREHKQAHGSQLRYMIISDLEGKDSYGNLNTYNFVDNGEEKKLTPKDFKAEYEATIAENINESFNDLANELGIYPRQGATPEEALRERNIALSRILQKEILSSPRYGIDLLIACSVDADGNFNIPLGDPIQSKRVEQLINSIIKNRFNKQEIAGGPVVQVTNLGLSRRLNIVFKDKNGKELKRADHQELSDSKWAEYLEENQDGVAYYECFAPISSNKLFERFADENGVVDIEEIKKVQPELLEMVGYRIPTEDKYSAAPLRIVGFLPKEAGEGLMLPYEITLITGSDFDVRLY